MHPCKRRMQVTLPLSVTSKIISKDFAIKTWIILLIWTCEFSSKSRLWTWFYIYRYSCNKPYIFPSSAITSFEIISF